MLGLATCKPNARLTSGPISFFRDDAVKVGIELSRGCQQRRRHSHRFAATHLLGLWSTHAISHWWEAGRQPPPFGRAPVGQHDRRAYRRGCVSSAQACWAGMIVASWCGLIKARRPDTPASV